jgi:exopolysaccharide biosynthesis polyprenyl glycosylphosphotransferase
MTAILVLIEAGLLFVAAAVTLVGGVSAHAASPQPGVAVGQAFVLCLSTMLAFYYTDLYDLRVAATFGSFARRLPQALGLALLLLVGLYLVFPEAKMTEGAFLTSLVAGLGVLLPARAAACHMVRSSPFVERVLILGCSSLARKLLAEIEARPALRWAVVGVVDDGSGPPQFHCRHVGSVADLDAVVARLRPQRLIVALGSRRGRMPVSQLLEYRAQGVSVESDCDTYERLTGKLAIECLAPSSLIFCPDFRIAGFHATLARALSLAVAIVGLVVTAPLFALIALAIWLDTGRPLFFARDRVGLAGRSFVLLKFRTMHPPKGETSEWVCDNGDRITRVGKWLRKFRLDELPQFVNVLRGEMNLVGPRPHPASNYELFLDKIPYYSLRAALRPGITGWAQVRYGYANNLEEETEKMRFDLYYIKHRSLWLDVRIVFATVKIVLLGRGSSSVDVYPGAPIMGAS